MTLKELKDHFEQQPDGSIFAYGLSEPFSWRGVYAEVAFEILDNQMSKEDILKNIQLAYDNTFVGYKGGSYRYKGHTDVHFESDYGMYTDGQYVINWINKIDTNPTYQDNEERFIKTAF